MRKLIAPILIGDFYGHEVRYFASPTYLATRQPDMPWHCVDDLWSALFPKGNTEAATFLKRKLRSDWHEVRTAATASGIVTIAPHFMAEGIFEAFLDMPDNVRSDVVRQLRGRYRNCCTQALKIMTANMDPVGKMLFALSAFDSRERRSA